LIDQLLATAQFTLEIAKNPLEMSKTLGQSSSIVRIPGQNLGQQNG
jgi:hypothetical protein